MKRKILNKAGKIFIFLVVANLPFLAVVQLIGMDTFLDSFQNPDSYLYMKNNKESNSNIREGYLILKKPAFQDFIVQNGDTIMYRTMEGSIRCESVLQVQLIHGTTVYYTTTPAEDDIKGPIYDTQILGKVIRIVDDNPWYALSLQLWDFSIKNLNTVSLFSLT
jgi:hypothetical protein